MRRKTTATRTATEIKQTGYSTKTSSDRLIDQSLYPTGHLPWTWVRLWNFYASGTRDAEVTKSLYILLQNKLRKLKFGFALS